MSYLLLNRLSIALRARIMQGSKVLAASRRAIAVFSDIYLTTIVLQVLAKYSAASFLINKSKSS